MSHEQFLYWLQGFAELSGDTPPTPAQWKSIREHLATCFKKVTPPVDIGRVMDDLRRHGTGPRTGDAWPPLVPPQWPNTGTPTIIC